MTVIASITCGFICGGARCLLHLTDQVVDNSVMNWQPDEAGLAQIIQLLKESQISKTEVQKAVQQVSSLRFVLSCSYHCAPRPDRN